jgi:ubiquinone/menaquinone biosynthesis C-methylase UbiE
MLVQVLVSMVLILLIRNRGYVICLDISKSMIYIAKETLKRREVLGDAVIGDAIRMPIRSNSIDSVIAIALVHHLPKEFAQEFFNEVYRALKPRGMVLATYLVLETEEIFVKDNS